MKLSDYVIDFIAGQGVAHIFELVGGAITHLVDSTVDRKDITCVSVHHEQAAAFAAEGYARINGKLGVAMATSGPGALNLLTGIGSCYFDSVPCLFITGQVNTYEYKFDRPVRQVGFQETDIVSVARPLTKYAEMVTDAGKIRYHLEKAVYYAQSGRPGPVLLDIPMDIQRAQIEPEKLESFFTSGEFLTMQNETVLCQESDIEEVVRLISEARRPVILAGGGVRAGDAVRELGLLTEKTGIPVVTSLMGIDAVPGDNPRCFGMIGVYGNRFSNLAVANCDLLLVLGSRLDTRQTGTRPETFARAAKIVHVDVDKHELDSKVRTHLAIQCQVKEFLESINDRLKAYIKPDLAPWYSVVSRYRKKYPTRSPEPEGSALDPNHFLEILSGHCGIGDIVCIDVGQNQMWAAQSFRLKDDQRMLISGGMGSMGFALPAALGAAKAAPGKRVVVISGDGGIQLNIQDLDTIVSHHLPVKLVVLNNGCLGMVRQFQDMYFDGRQQSTVVGYHCPDLMKIAEAYGLPVSTISSLERVEEAVGRFFDSEKPAFLEVKIAQDSCVNPKLLVNCPIEDMSPPLERDQLEKEMVINCKGQEK
ncbi:thiamine pyrophosphate-binding protein [candidate division TA06 bacterium]|uniref:Thiamine pyrophosphate-binding protein n=1 Tax=candidate division TA06 bacterium TaxID=2250710 RepID=A0A933IAQ6_UNCT6|nr:thiamine pyrophosphate-binding protein [candidate division TA06 bacterium]